MNINKLNVSFKNPELLRLALTHSSYANQQKMSESNEKLEFLGDAVLQLCITRHLYLNAKEHTEGELTKLRAMIVCEPSLYEVALTWDLGKHILLSHGEESTGGRQRASLLADAVEAVIAALYLDQGMAVTEAFILRNFQSIITKAWNHEIILDHKTRLQEILQESGEVDIHYDLLKHEGPPHRRKFFSRVAIGDITLGKGEGMSKKESEQWAARDALSKLATSTPDEE